MLSACKARLKASFWASVQSVPATNTKFLWCPLAWEPSKGRASSGLFATVYTQCLKHWLNVCGFDAFLVFSDQNPKQEPGSGCSVHLAPSLFLTSQAPPWPVLEDALLHLRKYMCGARHYLRAGWWVALSAPWGEEAYFVPITLTKQNKIYEAGKMVSPPLPQFTALLSTFIPIPPKKKKKNIVRGTDPYKTGYNE